MRFTIRDVLWLTVVVAVAASWWADRARLYADKIQAENDARDFWIPTISKERLEHLQQKYAAPPSD
jgi:hypothetical protein